MEDAKDDVEFYIRFTKIIDKKEAINVKDFIKNKILGKFRVIYEKKDYMFFVKIKNLIYQERNLWRILKQITSGLTHIPTQKYIELMVPGALIRTCMDNFVICRFTLSRLLKTSQM